MGELYRTRATTPEELPRVDSTGDAWFDPFDIRFVSRTLDRLVADATGRFAARRTATCLGHSSDAAAPPEVTVELVCV